MTPPLRTPPPSPPRKNSVDSLPDNNDNVDYSKDIKGIKIVHNVKIYIFR